MATTASAYHRYAAPQGDALSVSQGGGLWARAMGGVESAARGAPLMLNDKFGDSARQAAR